MPTTHEGFSLADFLGNRKADAAAVSESIARINRLFNNSITMFEQKISALENKITSLEQMYAVSPAENPWKKIDQNRKVATENLQNLRQNLMSELKDVLSRRPVPQ